MPVKVATRTAKKSRVRKNNFRARIYFRAPHRGEAASPFKRASRQDVASRTRSEPVRSEVRRRGEGRAVRGGGIDHAKRDRCAVIAVGRQMGEPPNRVIGDLGERRRLRRARDLGAGRPEQGSASPGARGVILISGTRVISDG
jgi:hypothetical protein